MEPIFDTPEWVHHSVFYQIFPDRFASSDQVVKPSNLEPWNNLPTSAGFKGGDLLGVLEHLDYLQDLGIDAIYFNPIFQSASNHRYHTHDYYRVDPLLGGDTAFKKLLSEAHRRGIRVILDGVFNHASRGFFQFNHILETGGSSPYLDWFRIKNFPLHAYEGEPNYDCWWNIPALPEFNHRNPQVRNFLFDIARYWIDQGVDGWRLDVPVCIDDDAFWQEFRSVVKRANPEAYITGEIAHDATRWLRGDQFDGVMNYLLAYVCYGFFGGEELRSESLGNWVTYAREWLSTSGEDFSASIQKLLKLYPLPAVLAQLNLLDSHDTARFLTIMRGNKALLKLAVLFIMTYPGAPSIYYGDEIGMEGSHDPDCRRAFPWDESQWDKDLFAFYKQVIALRRIYPVLQTGNFQVLYSQNRLVVYTRRQAEELAIVVLNRSEDTRVLDLPVEGVLKENAVFHNRLDRGEMRVENGHLSGMSIAPLSGTVLTV